MSPETAADFRASLAREAPPEGLRPALEALWRAAKGDWDGAHRIVQDEDTREAAWVHAHLHRVEGDLGNARYWYGRAGRSPETGPFDAEWDGIAEALLAGCHG